MSRPNSLKQRLAEDPNKSVEAALSELLVGMAMLANLLVLMRKQDLETPTCDTLEELGRIVAPRE